MSNRVLEFDDLGDQLLAVTRDEGRLTLYFMPDASLKSQLLDLARREAERRPFLELLVVTAGDVFKLEIAGPPDAAPVLDAIQGMASGGR